MYLIRQDGGDFAEAETIADAHAATELVRWCTNCHSAFIGRDTFAGRPAVLPRVVFEHKSANPGSPDVYLTVTCMTCAPVVWARLNVFFEEQEALRLAV